ncbi:MAG: helix-turn-helix domain-containing protein [Gemmataceae bacterium]|nr:helix-turn-helix domain-containing protein [Gemmataceae bacterium]
MPTAGPAAMRPHGELLTLPQCAQRLNISVRTLRSWIANGKFPAPLRLGAKFVRVESSTLDAFVDRLAQEAQAREG